MELISIWHTWLQIVVGSITLVNILHSACMRNYTWQGIFQVTLFFFCKLALEVSLYRFIWKSWQWIKIAQTSAIKQNMLQQMQETPSTRTRNHSACSQGFRFQHLEDSPRTWHVSVHMQHVQALHPDDYALYIAFAHWYLGKCATDLLFPTKMFFDETAFTMKGIFNMHNTHMWTENPLPIQVVQQTRFSVNVWVL